MCHEDNHYIEQIKNTVAGTPSMWWVPDCNGVPVHLGDTVLDKTFNGGSRHVVRGFCYNLYNGSPYILFDNGKMVDFHDVQLDSRESLIDELAGLILSPDYKGWKEVESLAVNMFDRITALAKRDEDNWVVYSPDGKIESPVEEIDDSQESIQTDARNLASELNRFYADKFSDETDEIDYDNTDDYAISEINKLLERQRKLSTSVFMKA